MSMNYPIELREAEQHFDAVDLAEVEPFRDSLIDDGASIQRLEKLMLSKAAPEDHAIIQEAFVELTDMVSTLIAAADAIRPMLIYGREMIEAVKVEWDALQRAKRR